MNLRRCRAGRLGPELVSWIPTPKIKNNFGFENYLDSLSFPYRRDLTRSRISSHRLYIEIGRYARIDRENRLCTNCTLGVLGDEIHFLLECPAFSITRESLFRLAQEKCQHFKDMARKDCNDIWLKFKAGISNQSLCNVSSSVFQDFVDTTAHDIPKDQHIFWENVYVLVHRYSNDGARLTTLEDTLTGKIVDTLQFCGDPTKPDGIAEGTPCPSYDASDECPMSAERAFWTLASRKFAEKAAGKIWIMLNATADPIYSPDTYFAFYEAPYLREGIVTEANIMLIHENPKSGSCSDPSLESLFALLEGKGIHTTCEENPRLVLLLLCSDNPESPVCTAVSTATKISTALTFTLLSLCLSLIFL